MLNVTKIFFLAFATFCLTAHIKANETATAEGMSSIELKVMSEGDEPQFAYSNTDTWFTVDPVQLASCEMQVVMRKNVRRTSSETQGFHLYTSIENLSITAYPVDKHGAGEPLYSLSLSEKDFLQEDYGFGGGEVWADSDYLAVAVGSELALYNVYSLATGKFLFVDDELRSWSSLSREGKCSSERYAAATKWWPNVDDDAANLLAVVTYSSQDGPIQKLRIDATAEARAGLNLPIGVELNPGVQFVRMNESGIMERFPKLPSKTDAASFDNMAILIRLTKGTDINIRLSEDRFLLAGADLPPGFTISILE